MEKILLYYKYVQIDNPHQIVKQQRKLCEDLGLKGRILIGYEGINGTLVGPEAATQEYKKQTMADERFTGIDFKESPGSLDDFPKLRVVFRKEIVSLGVDPEKLTVDQGGKHLTPEEVHTLLENKPENLVILDTRNNYESAIGTFTGSIIPDIENFRDLPKYIDQNIDQFKDKKVLMHCTGGVRCERATSYLNEKGIAQEVYQIEGGIHRYVEKYPEGHFRGKLYVFDGRVAMKINNDILSDCVNCKKPCDDYTNCVNAQCNKQITQCIDCRKEFQNTCSTSCNELVLQKKVNIRTIPKRPCEQKSSCSL